MTESFLRASFFLRWKIYIYIDRYVFPMGNTSRCLFHLARSNREQIRLAYFLTSYLFRTKNLFSRRRIIGGIKGNLGIPRRVLEGIETARCVSSYPPCYYSLLIIQSVYSRSWEYSKRGLPEARRGERRWKTTVNEP